MGFAEGLGIASLFQNIRQSREDQKLEREFQQSNLDFRAREQKLRADQAKFERDREKQAEKMREAFFETVGGQQAQGPPSPTGQLPQAGAFEPNLAQFAQLQQQAQGGDVTDQLQRLIQQGFIQTPAITAGAGIKSEAAQLASEKTRAQITKLDADAIKALRPPLPTKVGLALEASGGDPKRAIELLKPEKMGFNAEVEDGQLTGFSFGGSDVVLKRNSVKRIIALSNSKQPIQMLRNLLEEDPSSAAFKGRLQLVGANLKAQVLSFRPEGPKGKELQELIRKTKNVSEFEILQKMAAYALAGLNNDRITDADLRDADETLKTTGGATAVSMIPKLDVVLSMIDQRVQTHQGIIGGAGGGFIRTKDSPKRQLAAAPRTPQLATAGAAPQGVQQLTEDELDRRIRVLQGAR